MQTYIKKRLFPEKFIFPCPDFMTRSLLSAKTLVHNRKGEEKCSEGVVKVSNSGGGINNLA